MLISSVDQRFIFKLDIVNSDYSIYRDFFNSTDADNYFQELLQSINWHQEVIR